MDSISAEPFSPFHEDSSTRDRLLESGRRAFLKHGYREASLRRIVADAGFTSGAFYGYYSSKEELFCAIVENTAQSLLDRMSTIRRELLALPPQRCLAELFAICRRHLPELIDFLLENTDEARLLLTGSQGTVYESFAEDLCRGGFPGNFWSVSHLLEQAGLADRLSPASLSLLVSGYYTMLIRGFLEGKSRSELLLCMEEISRICEQGLLSLLDRDDRP